MLQAEVCNVNLFSWVVYSESIGIKKTIFVNNKIFSSFLCMFAFYERLQSNLVSDKLLFRTINKIWAQVLNRSLHAIFIPRFNAFWLFAFAKANFYINFSGFGGVLTWKSWIQSFEMFFIIGGSKYADKEHYGYKWGVYYVNHV